MPYQHYDKTPCDGPLLCAHAKEAGHEAIYADPIAEPRRGIARIEHATRDASAEQQLLGFNLIYRAIELRTERRMPVDDRTLQPEWPDRQLQNDYNWAIWEQHARVLLRTFGVEPAGEMPPIPEELREKDIVPKGDSPRDGNGQLTAIRAVFCRTCHHTWTPGYRVECTCPDTGGAFPRRDNWYSATKS